MRTNIWWQLSRRFLPRQWSPLVRQRAIKSVMMVMWRSVSIHWLGWFVLGTPNELTSPQWNPENDSIRSTIIGGWLFTFNHLIVCLFIDHSDKDNQVVEGLSWCEERLMAIYEVRYCDDDELQVSTEWYDRHFPCRIQVMMLENSKQGGLTDSLDPALVLELPLYQRQSVLANAVIDSNNTSNWHKGNHGMSPHTSCDQWIFNMNHRHVTT